MMPTLIRLLSVLSLLMYGAKVSGQADTPSVRIARVAVTGLPPDPNIPDVAVIGLIEQTEKDSPADLTIYFSAKADRYDYMPPASLGEAYTARHVESAYRKDPVDNVLFYAPPQGDMPRAGRTLICVQPRFSGPQFYWASTDSLDSSETLHLRYERDRLFKLDFPAEIVRSEKSKLRVSFLYPASNAEAPHDMKPAVRVRLQSYNLPADTKRLHLRGMSLPPGEEVLTTFTLLAADNRTLATYRYLVDHAGRFVHSDDRDTPQNERAN